MTTDLPSGSDPERLDMLAHVLLPVANEDDALATARELEPYGPEQVTALHAVEKGEGVPDASPAERSEALAEESYPVVRRVVPASSSCRASPRARRGPSSSCRSSSARSRW